MPGSFAQHFSGTLDLGKEGALQMDIPRQELITHYTNNHLKALLICLVKKYVFYVIEIFCFHKFGK